MITSAFKLIKLVVMEGRRRGEDHEGDGLIFMNGPFGPLSLDIDLKIHKAGLDDSIGSAFVSSVFDCRFEPDCGRWCFCVFLMAGILQVRCPLDRK